MYCRHNIAFLMASRSISPKDVICQADYEPSLTCGYLRLSSDPSKFDPRFGDSRYLMTEHARARLKGYLRTFMYMSICGLLFVLGGGAFFIHESISMANHKPEDHRNGDARNDVSTHPNKSKNGLIEHPPIDYAAISTASYAKELRVMGFIFLSVGTLLLLIGAPLSYQFWKRYQRAKEIERCPMLDPNYQEKLRKAYYSGSMGRPSLKRVKSNHRTIKVSKSDSDIRENASKHKGPFWRFSREKSVTADSFRLATHHHPSFNLVPIEGLAALTRDEMGEFSRFSVIESDEEPTADEKQETSKPQSGAGMPRKDSSFFSRFFGISDDVSSDDGIDNMGASLIDEIDGELQARDVTNTETSLTSQSGDVTESEEIEPK